MTFTLLTTYPDQGLLGIATASRSLALGRTVPAIDPTVGAVASQAWGNRELRHHMLTALREGDSPQQAIGRIPSLDGQHAYRQVAVVDRAGRIAAYTGESTSDWAGHLIRDHYVALGNVLTGPEVLEAMSAVCEHDAAPAERLDSPLDLARLMVKALAAGEAAGGDSRGRESAALMVAQVSDLWISPPELAVDLRVDHHSDPVQELGTLLERQIVESLSAQAG